MLEFGAKNNVDAEEREKPTTQKVDVSDLKCT